MNRLLIGNAIALLGAIMNAAIGLIKDKKNTLIYQTIDFGLMGLGNLVLGGISGFITNLISIIRNIICIKFKFDWPLKTAFIVIQAVMIYSFNAEGWRALLPFIAVALYVVVLDTNNIILFKVCICICQLLWAIYDISILNVSSFVFDVIAIITNAISIYQIKKQNKLAS